MPVTTEGRIHAAQVARDLRKREAEGARLLVTGCDRWHAAFNAFVERVADSKGPIQAARAFNAGIARLREAQKLGAVFVNCHLIRARSGVFWALTPEVGPHPLIRSSPDGVAVRAWHGRLRRNGQIRLGRSKLAFISWHALARMRERSTIDIFGSRATVAWCGFVGLLMRQSDKHLNGGMHFAAGDDLLCAGILRSGDSRNAAEAQCYALYDVVTCYRPNEIGPQVAAWEQGCAVTVAVAKYLASDDADPAGYADAVPVLPARTDDFVSRQLVDG